ncbi:serine protease grass [Drosophila eugracilis]|uniref:serine protease grass n=1 Tax=Drosophila eugracilis TaxID=29029 RepID=UPI0007E6448A|nr:serine protease grass [Drosophila eugracilis]
MLAVSIAMNMRVTGIEVLVGLLVICSNYGSAHYLYEECGFRRENSGETLGPWTALLHEKGNIFCSGTLITNRFILTAASCIKANAVIEVRLGAFGRQANELAEDHMVQFSLRYRHFDNKTLSNDIGLLRLTKNVDLKEYIKPICILLDPERKLSVNEFIGGAWGQDQENQYGPIAIQRKPQFCRGLDLYTQFCAGGIVGNLGSCNGLPGSALTQSIKYMKEKRHIQFGIASLGNMECQEAQGYTDVLSYYWWLQDVVTLFSHSFYDPKPI